MDKKDRAILKALQEDATMTVTDLAQKIGLSKSACWRRVQNLEESGIIGARVVSGRVARRVTRIELASALRDREATPFGTRWSDRALASIPTGGLVGRRNSRPMAPRLMGAGATRSEPTETQGRGVTSARKACTRSRAWALPRSRCAAPSSSSR